MSNNYSALDGVALTELVGRGELSASDVLQTALQKLAAVNPQVNAVVGQPIMTADGYIDNADWLHRLSTTESDIERQISANPFAFAHLPSLLKDNTNLRGYPTRHGSRAIPVKPADKNDPFTEQFLSTGLLPIAKTTLPEFGFTATTEFSQSEPTRNPWDLNHSTGGSSGGSAALVAAGVVPIAHANDGGGSIRIPASCCGLVGMKPSRGRLLNAVMAKDLPINIVTDGVVTRTVRDTARFYAAAEHFYRCKTLPVLGHVEAPDYEGKDEGESKRKGVGKSASQSLRPSRSLRIGVVTTFADGVAAHPECVAAAEQAGQLCAALGHTVEHVANPTKQQLVDDFMLYWAMLAAATRYAGRWVMHREFDANLLEPFTKGLAQFFVKRAWRAPAAIRRLKKSGQDYSDIFTNPSQSYDIILTPTLGQPPVEIGELRLDLPFTEAFEKLRHYAAFTPAQNVTGAPAISLPLGKSSKGLPIGVQLAADVGQEGKLLQLAYALEAAAPWHLVAPNQ